MRRKNKKTNGNEPLIKRWDWELDPEAKRQILVIIFFAAAGLSILSLFDIAGSAGKFITHILGMAFGWADFFFSIILIILGYVLLFPSRYDLRRVNYLGLFLFILSVTGLMHLSVPLEQATDIIPAGKGGGYIGLFSSYPLQKIMGFWATLIVLAALLVISFLTMFNTTLSRILSPGALIGSKLKSIPDRFRSDEEAEEEIEEERDEEIDEKTEREKFSKKPLWPNASRPLLEPQPPAKIRKKIDLPIDLLDNKPSKPTSGDIEVGKILIQKTLENFGIPVEMGGVSVGPTITQYTLKPSEGIKLSRITTLHNDLALALAAHPIRIEAPIPGKSLVGIEVPNQKVAIVNLRENLESAEFKKRASNLTIILGKDVAGKTWIADIGRMPHLLVAGATGSGKSVCLNTIIISLLYQNGPEDLKFILVDPKRVELPVYNGIPHLLTPVITDVTKTVNALRWAILEMDRRLELLSKTQKRNIDFYNTAHPSEKLPYILIVIDELADLMVSAGHEVEGAIVRLAQMARAVGIHLILATQRPSVDIITGLIKANIPARIAFSVASLVDSRTILDTSGAEKLLGRGDMLYTSAELTLSKRIQGAFVSDEEIKRVIDFLKRDSDGPDYNSEIIAKPKITTTAFDFSPDGDDGDELLGEAKEVISQAGKASASLLQRRLKVGYARAARILDLLEEQGFIGPADGAKPREILINESSDANMGETEEEDSGEGEYPEENGDGEEIEDEEETEEKE
ncbi:MAG: DNA translocase FtsK 4TM domain-containing protein [Patescibacteria group bacterium]|nr:DNA translocase FtsK 4TM domain-containing protein [Patescibacteria group bacterium]MDD5490905.1 DNA translocase FtsK 4TM domain-containing protein [Patescibacteria group bacterium]